MRMSTRMANEIDGYPVTLEQALENAALIYDLDRDQREMLSLDYDAPEVMWREDEEELFQLAAEMKNV